jgi:hypothetical protein
VAAWAVPAPASPAVAKARVSAAELVTILLLTDIWLLLVSVIPCKAAWRVGPGHRAPGDDLGLALLGFGAVKAGASRWTAAAIAAGAFGEAAGFATGNKPLLLISFAVLLAGLARPGSPGPTR